MKPLIGVNVDVNVLKPSEVRIARAYYEVIERANGVPVLLPPMKARALDRALDQLDGVLLIGGRDYSPANFDQEPHDTLAPLHPDREAFDLLLAKKALRRKMPILGICGGAQLLTIVSGGSLIQDIPSAHPDSPVIHRGGDEIKTHPVRLVKGCKLARIYGRNSLAAVVTSHHQAADRVGPSFQVTGFAEDGIVEAIEHRTLPFVIGVQWHPERDFQSNQRLFRAFVRHCKRRNTQE